MRLSAILKRPLASNILNCGNIKNEPITGGISSQLQVIQCNKINKRTSLLNSSSIRQLSSSGGIINTSDSSFGDNSPHISSEKPTKINLSKSPYTPVNLAYISYEKKLKDKAANDEASIAKEQEKSPLIIQHGLFGTKENWKTVSKEINFITNRAVYSIDGRNHGESPHSNEMTFALMAKDVKKFVDHLQHEKISFMGHHGLGGRIGMMIAMLYPEILDKLIVVDSTPLMSAKAQQRYLQLREAAEMLKNVEPELRKCEGYKRNLAAEQAIEHIVKDKRDVAVMLSNLVNGSPPTNSSKKTKSQHANGLIQSEQDLRSTENENYELWKCNLDAFLNNPGISNFPAFDESKAFHGKTLFVQSNKSNYISKQDELEIRRIFPNAEFCWIKTKNGSTWFHIEKHTEFMQAILGFLDNGKIRADSENNKSNVSETGDVAEKNT